MALKMVLYNKLLYYFVIITQKQQSKDVVKWVMYGSGTEKFWLS